MLHPAPRPLRLLPAVALLWALTPIPAPTQEHRHHHDHGHGAHAPDPVVHPDPRPGITAGNVLPASRFRGRAARAYEMARAIPQILDGIHCFCDCHDRDGLRSLLSCFENDMASTCGMCQGQVRIAHELHEEGRTLDEIRTAIEGRYGG